MSIDNRDPSFLFGQIIAKIENLEAVSLKVEKHLAALPCQVHGENINTLLDWQKGCKEGAVFVTQEGMKSRLSLKVGILIAVVSASMVSLLNRL